jgi:hypothetical protein
MPRLLLRMMPSQLAAEMLNKLTNQPPELLLEAPDLHFPGDP